MELKDGLGILLLLIMIFIQIIFKGKLIIKARKNKIDTIVFVLTLFSLIRIIYFYAKTYSHYIIGILAIINITFMWMNSGITKKGFSSMKCGLGIRKWDKISKITFLHKAYLHKDYIKVILTGNFKTREEVFYFDKKEYTKIMDIKREKLGIKTEVVFK